MNSLLLDVRFLYITVSAGFYESRTKGLYLLLF